MRGRDWTVPGLCLGLALLTWLVFFQTRHFEFVNFDDGGYLTRNDHVQRGLTWGNVAWAFTTGSLANWHPVTWLSHLLDVTLFGLAPGRHHLTSVVIHTANVVLLFHLLRTWTRELWPSALVAALFAIHPLHVESVAWVAERKDVLSTLFGFLTLWAYALNARRPSGRLRAAALGAYALGLMAKPMLVSMPVLLLLLDHWPLDRLRGEVRRRCLEKLPYAALAAASCVITVLAQRHGGAMMPLERMTLSMRLGNALLSVARYLGKALWPFHLSAYYPYPWRFIHLWSSLLILGVLAAVTVLAVRARRTRPYLLTGWLWFLVSLVPVIGLVQVGAQALADRYTYLPLLGPFFIVAWGGRDLARALRLRPWLPGAAAGMAVALLALQAHSQTSYWRTSIDLWHHALRVTTGNVTAQTNLAESLLRADRIPESVEAYQIAVRMLPGTRVSLYGLGSALHAAGRDEEALKAFAAALEAMPGDYVSMQHITRILLKQGRLKECVPFYQSLIALEPERLKDDPDGWREKQLTQDARLRLGMIYRKSGQADRALIWFREAFRAEPRDWNAGVNLALSLETAGRLEEAAGVLRQCVAVGPLVVVPHVRLGELEAKRGRTAEAAAEFRTALALQPGQPEASQGLRNLPGRP